MTAVIDAPVENRYNGTADDKAIAIRAVYKQVLGNPHVMESERLVSAESQFCNGNISLREFVRSVAKSSFYRARYFETCAPYRFVELNFKHLLGRAPADQAELSEHIQRCVNEGYDAEIDSYIDSIEYSEKFGENLVPYYTGATSTVGQKQVNYNRTLSLLQGIAGVDSATKNSRLVDSVATNSAIAAKAPAANGRLSPSTDVTSKRFKIVVKGSKFDAPRRTSTTKYIVPGDRMTPQIQRINRTGATIVSITEI
ncbi:phycobilisome rod-core linker polypeptide [Waterburya agarophytonicola K14]|uniref:Phycobilisome rod-core linker polypeptide n=1 Tax=Waterburya agarophytonicola KI4 TaxID=2874699 RepID=A0A964BT38_9CYAN|nr:phycobilisome rod-core linker polypeptide [Waterburya agarophytonicola]MCC0178341.1 phycobilisome rod-core linker polypeptide [Waterburya agarophytonicola KI4]